MSVLWELNNSFASAQLPLLKMVVLYLDKLVILDPVGARWATIDAEYKIFPE